METVDPKIVELGVVGLALILAYRLSGIVQYLILNKKGINHAGVVPSLACQTDPMHFQRIREIHKHAQVIDQQVARGEFQCAWKGRDEVRDMLEGMRDLTKAMDVLTATMRTGG